MAAFESLPDKIHLFCCRLFVSLKNSSFDHLSDKNPRKFPAKFNKNPSRRYPLKNGCFKYPYYGVDDHPLPGKPWMTMVTIQ